MKIVKHESPAGLEVKRLYLPFSIFDKCPNCGKEVERDFREAYLAYPTINEPVEIYFYCNDTEDTEGCYEEWPRELVLSLSLKAKTKRRVE